MLALSALILASCGKDDAEDIISQVTVDENNFQGTYSTDVTLDASKVYKLKGPLVMKSGAALTIPAGTRIEATGLTSAYIAISEGAKINVEGTSTNPVIMTSGEASPAAGDWGGLVICGDAPTNKGGSNGETAVAEVSGLIYGGSDVNDNSGSIRYLRVEYTGATFNSGSEFNGISLFGVGAGTTFEYIQSHFGGDDGIEFFGGTVSGKYLISTNSGDDAIDFADGWSGVGENWYIKGGAKAGVEGSNNGDNGGATPMTNATLNNISIVKGDGAGSEGGVYLKEGSGKWNATNVFIHGFEKGIKMKSTDLETIARIEDGSISLDPIQFEGITTVQDYSGSAVYFTEGNNTGAGNGAAAPSWAAGWSTGL